MVRIKDVEQRRLEVQIQIDASKSALERNKLGQFATPGDLAESIVSYIVGTYWDHSQKVNFLDPAIGTGSFFSAAKRVFGRTKFASATGIEIDGEFASAATSLWADTELRVIHADFTASPVCCRPNLVLSNPPYVRHHHVPAAEKSRLHDLVAERLGVSLSGLSGLYCYFLLLTDAWLCEDGISVWLVPSEFMDVNYGRAIKHYLTESVELLHIHRFCPTDAQFDDAIVSSAVVIFKKAKPDNHTPVKFTFGGTMGEPKLSMDVTKEELRRAKKWTTFPHSRASKELGGLKLGDLFTVKRGLATGDNSFFVMAKQQAKELGIPKSMYKPMLPSPRYLKQVVIESNKDGSANLETQLIMIDSREPLELIKANYPKLGQYLEGKEAEKVSQGYLASRRVPWYSQEHRDPCPFLCTYMGRGRNGDKPFRFIWNKSKALATNVYLMLYPKGELKTALELKPELSEAVFTALNEITSGSLTSEGRVYGGGLHKMEPNELKNVDGSTIAKAAGISKATQKMLLLS